MGRGGLLRVIAGTLRGRTLETPAWDGLRPSSDRLRETVFNILSPQMPGARVLDAFAGTGALGIEAISRGAASVVFLDRDPRATHLIARNLARCGLESGCVIIRATVVAGAKRLAVPSGAPRFDVILLDPPYDTAPDPALRATAGLVARHGVVVLEHARRRAVPEAVATLVRVRQVRSGDSTLSFYEPARQDPRPAAGTPVSGSDDSM